MAAKSIVLVARTVRELAESACLPPRALEGELDRYNEDVLAGQDTRFGKSPAVLRTVAEPPFYATQMRLCNVSLTACGPRVDAAGRVLDEGSQPIPGLYAAGSAPAACSATCTWAAATHWRTRSRSAGSPGHRPQGGDATVNFDFDEDQQELRRTVRRFLEHSSSEADVRLLMATEPGYDRAVWERMAGELGLHGLAIPEEYGGAGFSFTELGVVLEEMGRALLCAPFFASVVLAAELLKAIDDEQARKDYLPGIASGDTIATVALTEDDGGGRLPRSPCARCGTAGRGG